MTRKNSRSQKKLAILPIMVVAMLLTTGVAYAYWYDTLKVDGKVTTARFDVELSLIDWGDCEVKDVVTVNDFSFEWGDPGWNTIKITIKNAYPSYHGWIRIAVVSKGTIPAHMKGDPIIDTVPELDVWLSKEGQTCQPPYDNPFPDCWQLHGLEYPFLIHFHVYENDDITVGQLVNPEQGGTYSFKITLPLIQYNYDKDCST